MVGVGLAFTITPFTRDKMNEPLELQLARQIVNKMSGVPETSSAYVAAKTIIDAADARKLEAIENARRAEEEAERLKIETAERWPSVHKKGYLLLPDGAFGKSENVSYSWDKLHIYGEEIEFEGFDETHTRPIDVVLALLDFHNVNHTANELRVRVAELESLLADKTEKSPPA